jgi:tetratricopeptide (TPR) repeat protein
VFQKRPSLSSKTLATTFNDMKKTITILTLSLVFILNMQGQDAETYYKNGLEKLNSNKIEDAKTEFGNCIRLQPENYYAWFNRGICENRLKEYDSAIVDFNQAVKISPKYKKSYVSRSNAKRHLKDYTGSLSDCNIAISIDSSYAEAYYNRALIFEIFNKPDSACLSFNKALQYGLYAAKDKADSCNGTSNKHNILKLTNTAKDDSYGFSSKNPVKVGIGKRGGPANQRAYLDLLRDAQDQPIKYERAGSCCQYESKNGFMGLAALDHYEIIYLNEKGKKKKADVYISFYDYEEPLILFGFKTVHQN